MYLVLTQKEEAESGYKDKLFERYHFPKKYVNQVKPGRVFIYYRSKQGAPRDSAERYYFGTGVVGAVWPDPEQGDHYYAELLHGKPFDLRVSLRQPNDKFFEALNAAGADTGQTPAFRNAVRAISEGAYQAIIEAGVTEVAATEMVVETEDPALAWVEVLDKLNAEYAGTAPEKQKHLAESYLDRGTGVVKVLKSILGASCQICKAPGFVKRDGSRYVEAHHLDQVATGTTGALCSDNVILVCPTCHRRLHYATVQVTNEDALHIRITFTGASPVVIHRNTKKYLESRRSGLVGFSGNPEQ